MRINHQKVAHRARQLAVGTAASVFSFAAMATTPTDTKTEVLAEVTKVQADGIAIAGAVTLMIFMIAAAKWLRRAK